MSRMGTVGRAVWRFVWTGFVGIVTVYAELGNSLAAVYRARQRYWERRPEHLADRMDRAYRRSRQR